MVRCSVLSCKSDNSVKITGLSFHAFPVNDNLRSKWIAATGRVDWLPTKSSKICSKHFYAKHILKHGKKTYAHSDAVPVLFLNTKEKSCKTPKVALPCEESSLLAAALQGSTEYKYANEPTPSTSIRIFSKSIVENPHESAEVVQCSKKSTIETSPVLTPWTLMKNLKIARLKSEQRLKKLKALREKCRRLKKKVANLENIIIELKSR